MSQKETKKSNISKKRDRASSEEQLIKAGTAMFAKHGYEGCSTKMIASKAKLNESLIARYFGGKEGLLLAIIEQFLKDHCNAELTYPPQDNLLNELTCYLECKIRADSGRSPLARIIISHSLTNAKFHKKALTRIPMLEDEKFMERLSRLVAMKQIPKGVNLKELFHDVDSYLHGVYLFDLLLGNEPMNEVIKASKKFARIYAKGIAG